MSRSGLSARLLCAGYGRSQVLFDVSFSTEEIGITAVLGRNGAGKSTLLKTLVGELPPTKGLVALGSADANGWSTERRFAAGLGYVPQEHGVFAALSVRDNLRIGAGRRGDIERAIALFPKLGARIDQPAGALSGGERKMVSIGRALLANPKVLLLDEPTEGVWSGVVDEIGERLIELKRSIAIVLVEQHLELAFRVADQVVVLDRGHVALAGASVDIEGDPCLLKFLAP